MPKTKEVIKMISDFFLEVSNNQTKSKEILSTAGDDECVIVHFTEGDFTLIETFLFCFVVFFSH